MSNGEAATSVLLVDDDTTTRESLAGLLEHARYKVMQASTEEEALKLVESSKPRLSFVLLDQVLGTMESGTAAARNIAAFAPDILIVMYTADSHIDEHQKWRAMHAGAHRYMKKASAKHLLKDFRELIEDMTELRELTRVFTEFTDARIAMVSALVGLDVGVALIDREYRVWFTSLKLAVVPIGCLITSR